MHYDSYGNGVFRNPAMVKLDGSIIEPNEKMSELDIVRLNNMYPCENSCDQTNVQGKTHCHNQLHETKSLISDKDLLSKISSLEAEIQVCGENEATCQSNLAKEFRFFLKTEKTRTKD